MKFIKITMNGAKPYTLPMDQAEKLFSTKDQIVMLQENGKWSGQVINKAFIICADIDTEETERWHSQHGLKLPEGKVVLSPEQREKINEMKDEISRKFNRK